MQDIEMCAEVDQTDVDAVGLNCKDVEMSCNISADRVEYINREITSKTVSGFFYCANEVHVCLFMCFVY